MGVLNEFMDKVKKRNSGGTFFKGKLGDLIDKSPELLRQTMHSRRIQDLRRITRIQDPQDALHAFEAELRRIQDLQAELQQIQAELQRRDELPHGGAGAHSEDQRVNEESSSHSALLLEPAAPPAEEKADEDASSSTAVVLEPEAGYEHTMLLKSMAKTVWRTRAIFLDKESVTHIDEAVNASHVRRLASAAPTYDAATKGRTQDRRLTSAAPTSGSSHSTLMWMCACFMLFMLYAHHWAADEFRPL